MTASSAAQWEPAPPAMRLGTRPLHVRVDEATRRFRLDCLVRAYPDHLAGHDGVALRWCDGSQWILTDPANDFMAPAALLESDDVLLAFGWPYDRQVIPTTDPGRIRSTRFFTKIYGDCVAGAVVPRLDQIRWTDGTPMPMTRTAGVAAAFARVIQALVALDPAIVDFCSDPGEAYDCRVIAGTARRSMHAYGAAFDLNHGRTHYWLWSDEAARDIVPYINTVPMEIVRTFEDEGFIWGGRWAHFDTMHFEYRPELILAARG